MPRKEISEDFITSNPAGGAETQIGWTGITGGITSSNLEDFRGSSMNSGLAIVDGRYSTNVGECAEHQ